MRTPIVTSKTKNVTPKESNVRSSDPVSMFLDSMRTSEKRDRPFLMHAAIISSNGCVGDSVVISLSVASSSNAVRNLVYVRAKRGATPTVLSLT